jgi:hypothetical protein
MVQWIKSNGNSDWSRPLSQRCLPRVLERYGLRASVLRYGAILQDLQLNIAATTDLRPTAAKANFVR